MITITVSDICQEPVETVDGSQSLAAAAAQLADQRVGSLIVWEESPEQQGIITESDLVTAIARYEGDMVDVVVEDIMSTPLITVQPDTSIHTAAAVMCENQIKKLPVVDHATLTGILTTTELALYLPRHKLAAAKRDSARRPIPENDRPQHA